MSESQEQYEEVVEERKTVNRQPQGVFKAVIYTLCIGTSLFHVWYNTFGTLSDYWRNSLHFGLLGAIGLLLFPLSKRGGKLTLAIDSLLAGAVVVAGVYPIFMEEALFERNQQMIVSDFLFAGLAIVLALEICRRTVGWIIPFLSLFFLTYVLWWGAWLEGAFRFNGLSLKTLLYRMYFTDEGLFGLTASISSTYVFMFILFAAFLLHSGGGNCIIALARSVTHKITGGPGLVAVMASGLMGTISGSAIANTVSTGAITIPMMKKAGFKPKFAAGVETAASTGGQIMPPIMGAGAFIMAEWTQVPYLTIISIAFLPAMMYFCSVGFYVYFEARKNHIAPPDDITDPPMKVLIDSLPFFLPIGVLVGMLLSGFSPTYSAGFAIIAVIVASCMNKLRKRVAIPEALHQTWNEIVASLVAGGKNMVVTGILLVTVGTIIGPLNMTGASIQFSQMIVEWSAGNLLLACILITGASLLLGMGLPVTAAYIVLAVLAAPALQNMLLASSPLVQEMLQPDRLKALIQAPEFLSQLMMLQPELAAQAMLAANDSTVLQALSQNPAIIPALAAVNPAIETLQIGYLLTAHMIVYWVSQDSNVTPPVCLAAFAGAAIAGSSPMKTGLTAWKLAKGLYIIPLLFAYTPFINGTAVEHVTVFLFGTLGMFAFASLMTGQLYRLQYPWERVVLVLVAFLLFVPILWIQVSAVCLFVAVFYYNWKFSSAPHFMAQGA